MPPTCPQCGDATKIMGHVERDRIARWSCEGCHHQWPRATRCCHLHNASCSELEEVCCENCPAYTRDNGDGICETTMFGAPGERVRCGLPDGHDGSHDCWQPVTHSGGTR